MRAANNWMLFSVTGLFACAHAGALSPTTTKASITFLLRDASLGDERFEDEIEIFAAPIHSLDSYEHGTFWIANPSPGHGDAKAILEELRHSAAWHGCDALVMQLNPTTVENSAASCIVYAPRARKHGLSRFLHELPAVRASAMGMTWGVLPRDNAFREGSTDVGCDGEPRGGSPGCDAYHGDTSCGEERPLLCLKKHPYPNWGSAISGSPEFLDPFIALTGPVAGSRLTSPSAGDAICGEAFGKDWRMAEFHDGGSWMLTGEGMLITDERFWVRINDQRANCWDP